MDKFVQLVVFNIENEELAVHVNHVQEIVRLQDITRVPYSPDYIAGVINLRGMVVPVMELAKKYDMTIGEYGEAGRIIVLNYQDTLLGLLVCCVSEVIRLPKQNVEYQSSFSSKLDIKDIEGIGKIGNRVMTIISTEKLYEANFDVNNDYKERGICCASV